MNSVKAYRSAISYFLFVPVWILLVAAVISIVYSGQIVAIGLMVVVVFAIVLPIFLNTNYTISEQLLKVRCGVILRQDIPISSITRIEKTGTILSSPALSIKDRIEVFYGKYDSVIISPERRAEFIADLLRINPTILVSANV